jgi:hypothetical protein
MLSADNLDFVACNRIRHDLQGKLACRPSGLDRNVAADLCDERFEPVELAAPNRFHVSIAAHVASFRRAADSHCANLEEIGFRPA